MFKKALCPAILGVLLVACNLSLCQETPAVVVERGVTMKTRDGVILRADIYRPAGEGTFPVLLTRTPYDKRSEADDGKRGALHGYMVVVQDTRGRYTSEGEWYPFKHETDDGYDTVEWAAALPHSNGKVGMFGGSYVGATQMLAAIGHPPHLAGICPVVTGSNYYEDWTYQGGALEQWFDETWAAYLALDTADRVLKTKVNPLASDQVLPLTRFPIFNLAPEIDSANLTRSLAPYYLDWLAHPSYDSYWKQWSIEEHYGAIQVPALTIGAWYDIFLGGSLRNYLGMKAHAGTETARKMQRLIVSIGGHSGMGRVVGAVDFGPEAPLDAFGLTLDWYDYLFKGKQNEFATDKPVRIFVMGENKWRYEDSWPLDRAHETRYYLHSDGKANSVAGDGSLTTTPAHREHADSYVYNPADPVPTVGGPLCCDAPHLAPGPQKQNAVEARPDVLVYSTPPLKNDLEVTGPVTLDLFAKSSAVDTDFTGKLVDVAPDGTAINLAEGILRASYRDSMSQATPIQPDKIYEYKIDLVATSNVFLKGHRIRVEVSSSNFPRFARNLNTGKSAADSAEFVKATNTVLHDTEHPSAIVLPVVPR